MIAITVSTNYYDILPYVLEANLKHIDRWIFITDANDQATIDLLTPHDNITILYWDFKNNGRIFDKGGALKYAQQHAYVTYPDDWYLILDSDICFPENFSLDTAVLDAGVIYTTNRQDFNSASSYRQKQYYYQHPLNPRRCLGYFQLYKQHLFYKSSWKADQCDDEFSCCLPNKCLDIMCSHLGHVNTNWKGRAIGSDFLVD